MIHLSDALNQMAERSPDRPFSIKFCTYNRTKNRGGEIIELENAIRCGQVHNMKKNQTIGIRTTNNSHHPYAVHIRLITEFDGEKVHY